MLTAHADPGYLRTYETIEQGFVTPYWETPDWANQPEGKISGCVYRRDGTKVELSERHGGYLGDRIASVNPDLVAYPDNARHLHGKGLYLGHDLFGHYGHFIFESLSTFWIFEEFDANEFQYFLLHPLISRKGLPDYARYCLEQFHIDPQKIVVVGNVPIAFDELVVPERLSRINHSSDPRLRSVYERIAAPTKPPGRPNRRLYVSRRRFNFKQFHRNVANEVHIEALFKMAGFDVIYPEELTYPKQLALCASAEAIAGVSGSNLFSVAFAPKGALLIELGDPRYQGTSNPCQCPLNKMVKAREHFIPFKGRQFGPRLTMLFDIGHIAREVDKILRNELLDANRAPLKPPVLSTRERFEIGFQCIRPTLGHIIRGLTARIRQ